ncbi:MAG TPA: polyprenol monophosphomannose synthase [Candidatus Thermoplasmatota archaeon]|nr:polyprenol monophosphomannose synthase [Candidatus Thermoplasmatota archaeon]
MPQERVTIVVPTYNERDNLPRLVEGLARAVPRPWRVLVVDDASPDGTAAVARRLAQDHPVDLLERSGKLGLGSAYRQGFSRVSEGLVVTMDADLSHDPRFVPELIASVRAGADLALGSRYVPGGRSVGWTMRRRITSRAANLLARATLHLPVRDVTTGFRCYGPRARSLALETLSDGYAFQIEAVHLAAQAGLALREVPIEFRDRRIGASKLGSIEVVKFLRTLRRLRAVRRAEDRRMARVRTGS